MRRLRLCRERKRLLQRERDELCNWLKIAKEQQTNENFVVPVHEIDEEDVRESEMSSALWLPNRLEVPINDQRIESKMIVSKRIFLNFMFLLYDLNLALAASSINSEPRTADSDSFVEYFKDHEISEKQARENLRGMKERDFQTPAYCPRCSAEHMRYCHSVNLLKDHCCCSESHNKGSSTYESISITFVGSPLDLITRNRFGAPSASSNFLVLAHLPVITANSEAWQVYAKTIARRICINFTKFFEGSVGEIVLRVGSSLWWVCRDVTIHSNDGKDLRAKTQQSRWTINLIRRSRGFSEVSNRVEQNFHFN